MSKEQQPKQSKQVQTICKHFEDGSCGFAKFIKEKPTELMTVPEVGCGKPDTENCPRIVRPGSFPLQDYGPSGDTEIRIVFPVIRTNDKGHPKRLPGGIHK